MTATRAASTGPTLHAASAALTSQSLARSRTAAHLREMLVRHARFRLTAPLHWTAQSVGSRQKLRRRFLKCLFVMVATPSNTLRDVLLVSLVLVAETARWWRGQDLGTPRAGCAGTPRAQPAPPSPAPTMTCSLYSGDDWAALEGTDTVSTDPPAPPIVDPHSGNEVSAASTVNLPQAASHLGGTVAAPVTVDLPAAGAWKAPLLRVQPGVRGTSVANFHINNMCDRWRKKSSTKPLRTSSRAS